MDKNNVYQPMNSSISGFPMLSPSRNDTRVSRRNRRTFAMAAIGAAAATAMPQLADATINPGDVAIIRMNNTGAPNDNFSIVLLKDVVAGDTLFWTDNGWSNNTNAFRTGEGAGTTDLITTNLAAGTVLDIAGTGFSNSGDQVFLFTGTVASPTLLYGVDWGNAAGWDGNATSSNTSALPTSLTSGNNSTTFDYGISLGTAVSYTYTGTRTGNATSILGAIANSSNWTSGDATNNSFTLGNFTITTAGGGGGAKNLTWNVTNGTWDTASNNWTGNGTLFSTGDNVTFGDGHQGNVTIIAGGVAPGSTLVNNTSGNYTFQNAGGDTNGITTGSLTKSGAGTLILLGQNTYSGGTNINGGNVVITNDNQLGNSTGSISLGGGELDTAAAITSARAVSLSAATNNTIDTKGFASTFGGISGNGTLTVTGGGIVSATSLTGASNLNIDTNTGFTNTSVYAQTTGSLNVSTGGNFTLDYAGTGTSTIVGATINGALVLKTGTPRLNFNTGTVSGNGTLQVQVSGTLISNTSGTAAGTVNIGIILNSTNTTGAGFTKGDVTAAGNYTAGNFVTTIGGTKATSPVVGNLIIGGVISGYADLNLTNSSSNGGGGGEITLNAANTYTGTTTINYGTPDVAGTAAVTLGIDDALPTTTSVVAGTQLNFTVPVLDMNGHNQHIVSLSDGQFASATKFLTITNKGSVDSTLTIDGNITPATSFSGVIADGSTNKVALSKAGTNAQTLSGINTYSGDTNVTGGNLTIASTGSIKNSNTFVSGGAAVLELDGTADTDALGDTKSLSLANGGTAFLNFVGIEHVGSLTLDGTTYYDGLFTSTDNPSYFSGTGAIAVPEPTSLGVIGMAGVGLLARRRRARKA